MPLNITMPKLSPTMESGVIAKWRKKEGDFVHSGEVLLEVTTDKATLEHSTLEEGYLRKILVSDGKEASIGMPIAILSDTLEEDITAFIPKAPPPKKIEEKIVEKEVVKESLKAPTTASFQEPLFVPEPPLEGYTFPSRERCFKASPLAKKLAQERNLDLSSVVGSGPSGRIVSKDLEKAKPQLPFVSSGIPELAPGSYEEEPLTSIQKVVGSRLQQSKMFIPHFYVQQKIEMDSLLKLRAELKESGIPMTLNDFMIKACAMALKLHPHVNSGYNSKTGSIIRFKTYDIAFAVAIEGGLITPIIRHASYKSLIDISKEAHELGKKAKEGKLSLEEFKGGSFTISNLGMFGVHTVFPIINPPQAAILGVGGLDEVVKYKEGSFIRIQEMVLTLASDHRVVNGADAASFLKTLKRFLEKPALLLL